MRPEGGFFLTASNQVDRIQQFFAVSFALQGGTSRLVSAQDWCASHAGYENQTNLIKDENRLYRRRHRTPCRFMLPERRSRPKQAGLCGTDKIMTFTRFLK